MTQQLVKGQAAPWPAAVLRVEVLGADVDVSALLLGEDELVRSGDDLVFYNQPTAGGVTWTASPQRLDVDLAAVAAGGTARVRCVVSVDGPAPMSVLPRLVAVLSDGTGSPVAEFALTGLTTELAVVVCDVYRHAGAWKVRAVSQGYDGGLAQAVTTHGVEVDAPVAAGPPPGAVPPVPPPPPTATDGAPGVPLPPGTSEQERLFARVRGIIEDAARSTASLRSTVEYAEKRRDADLSAGLDDPRLRTSPAAQAGWAEQQRRHDELVATATANHRRDVDQLVAELWGIEPTVPASMAPWWASAWHPWQPPREVSVAVRTGDLHVPEAPDLRLPLLQHVLASRPLWVDSHGDPAGAGRFLRTLVARFLAAFPVGQLSLDLVDLSGTAAPLLAPLGVPGCRVLAGAATTAAQALELLDDAIRRIDLVQMARRADALDSLDEQSQRFRLLVLADLPEGYDDGMLARIRYVLDEGPEGRTRLLLSGDVAHAVQAGPLVSALLRETLRLPASPDDHLLDAWTGTSWTFTPDLGPDDPALLDALLARASAGVQQT